MREILTKQKRTISYLAILRFPNYPCLTRVLDHRQRFNIFWI
ncbi:hypothetical protein ZOSMA_51G00180 [Zostera marina]|uniref:Uncharacterized protein n=1 Tax=Zostera marina TaxID=29655 RepID=A0A0K9NXV3_ZOSMR|nr:hypothetical protein ZOSMA_51G00180 [Zostera marina]